MMDNYKIEEMENEQFFEAIHENSLFEELYSFVSGGKIVYEEDWKKLSPVWKQIGFNYCIIRNLNPKRKRGRLNSISQLRRDLAIYRLYRYQNIPMELLAKICQQNKSYLQNIIGRIFKMLCINDEKCVFRNYF